jgi:hypothetical protein
MLSAHMLVLGDAGLQRLTMYPSCSLVGGQPSQTSGWRFGSTALPLLFGVPTLRGRRFGSTALPLLYGVPTLRGRRFGSTALPLLFGATGSVLGGAHQEQLIFVDRVKSSRNRKKWKDLKREGG